jgi:hypothetical protein
MSFEDIGNAPLESLRGKDGEMIRDNMLEALKMKFMSSNDIIDNRKR